MHLAAMTLFAFFVAVVFGIVSKDTSREQFRYGVKVFFAFMGIGLALAWVMYPIS
jgi:undecaprenyl pyrophosphate phosphatase UppP